MREEIVGNSMYGEDFSQIWPASARPVRLWFAEGVRIEGCIISTPSGPDKATFLNSGGEPCEEVDAGIFERPYYILLE